MAQWVKALAVKLNDLGSLEVTSQTHTGEKWLLQVALWLPHALSTHINAINNFKKSSQSNKIFIIDNVHLQSHVCSSVNSHNTLKTPVQDISSFQGPAKSQDPIFCLSLVTEDGFNPDLSKKDQKKAMTKLFFFLFNSKLGFTGLEDERQWAV